MRPSKTVMRAANLNQERQFIDAVAGIMHSAERQRVSIPEPVESGLQITLPTFRKNDSRESFFKRAGIPLKLQDLDALVLQPQGGWGIFKLPPMPEVYVWLGKAAKHPNAAFYLNILAKVSAFSQLSLSEAAGLAVECLRLDPRKTVGADYAACEWAEVAIMFVNAWEARQERFKSEHLGDVVGLAERLAVFRSTTQDLSLAALEYQLAERRNKFAQRGRNQK